MAFKNIRQRLAPATTWLELPEIGDGFALELVQDSMSNPALRNERIVLMIELGFGLDAAAIGKARAEVAAGANPQTVAAAIAASGTRVDALDPDQLRRQFELEDRMRALDRVLYPQHVIVGWRGEIYDDEGQLVAWSPAAAAALMLPEPDGPLSDARVDKIRNAARDVARFGAPAPAAVESAAGNL